MYKLSCVVVAAAVFSSAAHADTIHVDIANCPGPGDGSELDPYCSIQTAIDSALVGDDPEITNCTFLNNNATTLGGGVHANGIAITDCTFIGNVVTGGGGGASGTPGLIRCTFIGNTAQAGGGAQVGPPSPNNTAAVIDCIFTDNFASVNGGALDTAGSGDLAVTNPTFCNNSPNDVVGQFVLINPHSCHQCPADIDGDTIVGINDFLAVLAAWGVCK